MAEQEQKFGIETVDDVEDQMRLYVKWKHPGSVYGTDHIRRLHRASSSRACSFVLKCVMLWSMPHMSIMATMTQVDNRLKMVVKWWRSLTLRQRSRSDCYLPCVYRCIISVHRQRVKVDLKSWFCVYNYSTSRLADLKKGLLRQFNYIQEKKDFFFITFLFYVQKKKKWCWTNRSLSDLVAPIDIPCYLRSKSKCSNFGQNNMGSQWEHPNLTAIG